MSDEQLDVWTSIRAASRVYAVNGRAKESRLSMAGKMKKLLALGASKADCADAAMTTLTTVARWIREYDNRPSEV